MAVLSFGLVVAVAQQKPEAPVLEHKVEPEYGADLQQSYFVDRVSVEMMVDELGKPAALVGASSLPDNVVRALSQWRFRPVRKSTSFVAFTMRLTVPVRRPITRSFEESLPLRWRAGKNELTEAMKAGALLKEADAASIEQKIESDPNNIDNRATLLAYAAANLATVNPERAQKLRGEQIAWMVQHWPDEDVLGSPLAFMNAAAGPLQDAGMYQQIRDLWLKQVSEYPDNKTILRHAIGFLKLADPERAEQLILSPKMDDSAASLGDLYALAALGVRGLNLKTGLPQSAEDQLPAKGFAQHARSELESTQDARLLISAMASLSIGGRALAEAAHLPAGYQDLCEKVRSRVMAVFPESSASCDTSLPIPEGKEQVEQVSTGAAVQGPSLIRRVQPRYPVQAKSRYLQGSIRFSAVIGKDGTVKSLELEKGGLVFYETARAAVLQWVYRPAMLNGQPVEVRTDITVNYILQR